MTNAVFGSVQLACQGAQDAYLVKYSPDGQARWGVRGGASLAKVEGQSVTVDGLGNVTLLGEYDRPITFSGVSFTTAARGNHSALYLLQYDATGTVRWSQQVAAALPNAEYASGYDLAVDSRHNVLVLGQAGSYGTIMFGTVPLTATNNGTVFLAKCSPAGNFQWVQSTGNNPYNYGHGVSVDGADNIYITGEYYGYIAFGTSWVFRTPFTNTYVAQYNPAGAPQWTVSPDAPSSDGSRSVAVDAGGNVYLGGYLYSNTAQSIPFGPYTFPPFIGYRGWIARLGPACPPWPRP